MGSSMDLVVNSLVVSGSNVYAGGYCYNSSGSRMAGYWKNGTWISLSMGKVKSLVL
jgi:hypothetical protein